MNVWIFQTGEPLQSDSSNTRSMRSIALSNALLQQNHKVVVWSSAFYHQNKTHRVKRYTCLQLSDNYQIRLIPSMGYNKNIGLARILDHIQLAINLRQALSIEKDIPDVAFIGYPPIEFAFVASSWLLKRHVPFVVDVKDQWPEIFIRPFPNIIKPIMKLFFYPYFLCGRRVILNATSVSSITKTFLSWACNFAERQLNKNDKVFPLSSLPGSCNKIVKNDISKFWNKNGVKKNKLTRFFFVGTFSSAFDFKTIRKAAESAKKNNLKFQFVLCGDGETLKDVKNDFSLLDNVVFPGWINQPQMRFLADISDAALAPYFNHSDFLMSVPNKVTDYLSFGSPIITPLKGEVKKIILKYSVGLTYKESDANSLLKVLLKVHYDKKNCSLMSKNAKNLYLNKYNGEIIYENMIKHLEKIRNK